MDATVRRPNSNAALMKKLLPKDQTLKDANVSTQNMDAVQMVTLQLKTTSSRAAMTFQIIRKMLVVYQRIPETAPIMQLNTFLMSITAHALGFGTVVAKEMRIGLTNKTVASKRVKRL